MQLRMIGWGRMGANLTRRLIWEGHQVVVFGVGADSARQLEPEGVVGTTSLEQFMAKGASRRCRSACPSA